jgi:hypothetical protein
MRHRNQGQHHSPVYQFIAGLSGSLHVTLEEGTWAAWLHDLLKPHVRKIVVCNPRRNALLKEGNKSDRIDAHKLTDLWYLNKLKPVYHGEHGVRTLKELVRSHLMRPEMARLTLARKIAAITLLIWIKCRVIEIAVLKFTAVLAASSATTCAWPVGFCVSTRYSVVTPATVFDTRLPSPS